MIKRVKKYFGILGPGITTGAAGNDPSGIATYSQTGAQFGYKQLWIVFLILPFQIAIQEACARIGAVTGEGLASVIKKKFNPWILYSVIFLFLIANVINIGANLGAMAATMQLIFPLNFTLLTVGFTTIILAMQIFLSYRIYANILKWLALSLITYPLTAIMIHINWGQVFKATFIPHLEFNFAYLFILTGLLGTTVSPYLFVWQASQEVEEVNKKNLNTIGGNSKVSRRYIKRMRIDNFVGMLSSQICSWSIIVVSAAVLHQHGIIDIKNAADAAKALEPFIHSFPNAGLITKIIFATGIIGLGLLSIPILAGSCAYAIGETYNMKVGLDLKFYNAYGFYGIIIFATLIGLGINLVDIDPFKALIYSAVLNGLVAVPLIFLVAVIAQDKKFMGKHYSRFLSNIFVWLTFLGILGAGIGMVYSLFFS
ncbi:MAG: Nramp family divalent metal transporter [Gammaproteobacteria bacterium]|nr:Nramp family divalent metal transporter [Gammaproteobacteria bacterium]